MRLLVTGSRDGFPGLWEALDTFLRFVGEPDEVHVREQTGVDQSTREWTAARGLKLVPEEADMSRPSPQRYHEGNQRMVDKCDSGDIAVGFPGPKSRGTYACLAKAYAAGLRCYVADHQSRRFRGWQP